MIGETNSKWKRAVIVLASIALLCSAFTGIFSYSDQEVSGAQSIGTIKVTNGNSRTIKGSNYLLDGDIEVIGDDSTLIIENSTIQLSQDVGLNGVIGGGDDHIYHISVQDGGRMILKNSTLTTQTDQLHPYFAIHITVEGVSSVDYPSMMELHNSIIEGPGEILVKDSARLEMTGSITRELSNTDNLDYDMDDDGQTDDDVDFNNDGPVLTMETGAQAMIIDSQIRDTFSLTKDSRDGIQAGNITLTGADTNLTAINSFLDIDFETNISTGSHNMLKLSGGAKAHLVGVTMNNTSKYSYPAVLVEDSSSYAVYYRWIAAHVVDTLEIDVTGLDLDIMKVEGSQNTIISNGYLTDEMMTYMDRDNLNWASTDSNGWVIVPVITDVFTTDSMPNSQATPDYMVKATIEGESITKSAKFKSYPNVAKMGDEIDLMDRITSGGTVDSKLVSLLGGDISFEYQAVDPDTTSYFPGSPSMTISSTMYITGSSSVVNGKVYPSYYSFDGSLVVESGGKLVINDTVVMFQTDENPAYILVKNGGEINFKNVTLGSMGDHGLYAYVMGSTQSEYQHEKGNISIENFVVKDGAKARITTDMFSSSLTVLEEGSSLSVWSDDMAIPSLKGRKSMIELSGGDIGLDSVDIPSVQFMSESSTIDHYLDLSGDSSLIDVLFNGSLPSGRSKWIKAVGPAKVNISWEVSANVVDSGGNPIPGAEINVSRVYGSNKEYIGSFVTDGEATAKFNLLEKQITSSGTSFMGNYKLKASYRGYDSKNRLTSINGSGIDLTITIPGGPNIVPNSLKVNGPLIDGQTVEIIGNLSNMGIFDATGFNVELMINGERIDSAHIDGLGAGKYEEVSFNWQCEEGDVNFTLIADPENEVSEVGESDNLRSSYNIIGIGPDYSIEVNSQVENWVYGIPGTIELDVSNEGEDDPQSNNFTVDIRWEKGTEKGVIAQGVIFDYIEPLQNAIKEVEWTPTVTGQVTIVAEVVAEFDRSPLNSWDSLSVDIKTLPDLIVKDGSFSVDVILPVTINTTVEISFDVLNTGELPSEDFSVALYDGGLEESNKVDSDKRVPSLQPGETITISFMWRATAPIGDHDLITKVDLYDDVMEQDENNTWDFQVQVDTEPDIYFETDIGTSPSRVTEGKNTTIWVHVANKGKTMARDVEIRFSLDSDTNMIGSEVLNLLPGQSKNTSLRWSSRGPGTHTILVFADPEENIVEINGDNNFKSTDIIVIGRPDITMGSDDLKISPSGQIPIGTNVYLNATIWNRGETDTGNVIVRFYDGNPEMGGKIIQWQENKPSVTIDELKAGSYERVTLNWIAKEGGEHNIFAVMDISDIIDEDDEKNNIVSWPAYVMTLPDLSFTDLGFYQGGFQVHSSGVDKERDPEDMIKLHINATLRNTGDTPAPEFAVNFYNGNPIQDASALEIGELRYPDGILQGNDEMEVGIDWSVDYPKGIRMIYLTVSLMEGSEQNIENNDISAPLEVFDIDDVPEIEIDRDSISIYSKYPGMEPLVIKTEQRDRIAYRGMNLSVSFNITNIGGVPAKNLTVYLRSENSTGEYVEFMQNIPTLSEDETQLINGYWKIDDLTDMNLSIVLDPFNQVKEFDEGNNLFVYSLDVKEAPDLEIEMLRSGDAFDPENNRFEMTVGESYSVSYSITNTGNMTYSGLDVSFNGPAINGDQTISLEPFSEKVITFIVKPETEYETEVNWKCSVNQYGRFYESNLDNNDASGAFMISEKEEESFPWLIFILILIVIVAIVVAISYYVINRFQKSDMAKCSNCGSLVEMDATVCPQCGIEFSDELECECGEIIPPGSTECPSCGKPVEAPPSIEEEEEFEEVGEEEPDTEGEEESEEEEFEFTETPEESEELEDISEEEIELSTDVEEEEMAECFECGAVIPISAPICPHCGAVFE